MTAVFLVFSEVTVSEQDWKLYYQRTCNTCVFNIDASKKIEQMGSEYTEATK
jgi:hypothetical protein